MSNIALPLVSIGMPVWNGEAFLNQAIESLLSQDYKNIELIVLDNLSTDKTSEICKKFSLQDSRVQYVLDTQHRDVIGAFNKIASLVKGNYFMVGNDDDVYEPSYISTLMKILLENPDIGLVYSGCNSILTDGTIRASIWKWMLTKEGSKFSNFIKFFFKRNPIPICFGIIKTEVHKDGLTYFIRPDSWGFNHDNLYILRILSQVKVHSISDKLFFYRDRDRGNLYKERGQIDNTISSFLFFRKLFFHQINVSRITFQIISNSPFSFLKKIFLYTYVFFMTFYFSFGYVIANPLVSYAKRLRQNNFD